MPTPQRLKLDSLSVIGYGLAILFAVTCWWYVGSFRYTEFWSQATNLSILSLLLFFNSFFIVHHHEWSRLVMVSLNCIMAMYIASLNWQYPGYVQPAYVFINIALILFFNMRRVKVRFHKDWDQVRKSILVVDDDEGLQKIVKRILLNSGYSVLSATTGERGIQVAKLQKPNLIILDVLLPGIKGREVCKRLKADDDTKAIPVIFLTAKDSPDDVEAEKAAGGLMHLTKPVNSKILINEIKKILE